MIFYDNKISPCFTRLHAMIVEEDGAFTVSVRLLNHLKTDEYVWGQEIASTFEMASLIIGCMASDFSIGENCISIKIVMRRYRDGTVH